MLLDTNALFWFATGSPSLGKKARLLIDNTRIVNYSSISVAELTMKSMVKKLGIPSNFYDDVSQQGITALAFTHKHAIEMSRFGSLAGHDPFDRMILAQAASEQMELLTADRKLLDLGFPWIIDARA